MSIEQITKSKYFNWVLIGILELIILLGVFKLGEMVGFRKANFSFGWGNHYEDNFDGPRGFRGPSGMIGGRPPFGMMDDRNFLDAHGTAGTILKIDKNVLVIKGNDNIERSVVLSEKTVIVERQGPIMLKDLKVDEGIMVIGSPNDKGQIDAKFIRVFNNKNK